MVTTSMDVVTCPTGTLLLSLIKLLIFFLYKNLKNKSVLHFINKFAIFHTIRYIYAHFIEC